MSSERIADLAADGSPTGRYLAVGPDGRLVGVPDSSALKPGWRLATREDIEAKQALEADRKAEEAAEAAKLEAERQAAEAASAPADSDLPE